MSQYVYDGDHIVSQFDGSNKLTHRYLHGPNVDQILADENVGGTFTGRDRRPRHGSRIINSSARCSTTSSRIRSAKSPRSRIRHRRYVRVHGPRAGRGDGLNYHRARYLDVAVGRWVSEDPIGFEGQQTSLVQYVGNDAIAFVDPSGNEWSWAACGSGAAAGAGAGAVIGSAAATPGAGTVIGGVGGAIIGCIAGGVLSTPIINAFGGDTSSDFQHSLAGILPGTAPARLGLPCRLVDHPCDRTTTPSIADRVGQSQQLNYWFQQHQGRAVNAAQHLADFKGLIGRLSQLTDQYSHMLAGPERDALWLEIRNISEQISNIPH